MKLRIPLLALGIPLCHAVPAVSQDGPRVPQRQVSVAGMVEHPTSFTSLKQVAVLPDGRVVAPDPAESRIHLLDFSRGTARLLSRPGSGPGEYRAPGAALSIEGGAVAVYDQRLGRFLTVLPNGAIGSDLSLPRTVNSSHTSYHQSDQYVRDSSGAFAGFRQTLRGQDIVTSLHRIESDGRSTPLTVLRQQEKRPAGGGSGVQMFHIVQFSPADVWAVAPDGWVAVVQAEPYRVVWHRPNGSPITGAAIDYSPIRVTEADREAARREMAGGTTVHASSGGVTTSSTMSPPPSREPVLAETKPPFPIHIPHVDAAGRVWVRRTTDRGPNAEYDVIDRRGVLVERVTFPGDVEVVGFDSRHAYATWQDDDDLLHLRRYSLGR